MNNEYAELDFDNLDMVALTGYSEQKKKCLKDKCLCWCVAHIKNVHGFE